MTSSRLALPIELDREEDGRWIADVPDLPGVLVYGETSEAALRAVKALALRVIADRLEHGEALSELRHVTFIDAEDEEDARAIREAWAEQGDAPLIPFDQVKRELGLPVRPKDGRGPA